MNLKHLSIGLIFLIIGLSILSPFEEIFILIPLSIYLDVPELVPLVTVVAAICLGIGIFLVGKSSLRHFGLIGKVIAGHPVVMIGSIIIIAGLIYLMLI